MVGLLTDVNRTVPSHFQYDGDAILLVGDTRGHLGGSAYWAEVLDTIGGAPPPIDLAVEHHLQRFLVEAAEDELLSSAHDLSDGGLAVAVAECCIGGPWDIITMGAEIDLGQHAEDVSDEGWLFGEDGARALISCPPAHVAGLQRSAHAHGLACHYLGLVYDEDPRLIILRGDRSWEWSVDRLRKTYMDAIPRRMAVVAPATGGD
jgi:phosphoribosylformylglycinamidine synthase